jgi:hypothetical protein
VDFDFLRGLADQVVECDEPIRPLAKRQARRLPLAYRCANCDETFVANRPKVYCCPRCHDQADLVRYERRYRAEFHVGHLPRMLALQAFPPDIRDAIKTKSMFALGEGYDASARRLSPQERDDISQRDEGRCVLCGALGVEIDHIDGPRRDPNNLRLLCAACNQRLAYGHARPIADNPDAEQRLAKLTCRIEASKPLRDCDDHIAWKGTWRGWVAEHTSEPEAGG